MNMSREYQHTLRRREHSKTTARTCYGYCLAAFLFGILVVVFQPPTTTTVPNDTGTTTANHSNYDGLYLTLMESISIVACDVSTPHTKRGETHDGDSKIANGRFDIAILKEDLLRKGSSAAAFWELVGDTDIDGFYDGNYVFRVVPGFVAQWGIRDDSKPATAAKLRTLPDSDRPFADPSKSTDASHPNDRDRDDSSFSSSSAAASLAQKILVLREKQNVRGTITMIKGGTGQVFVNTGDNRRLDQDGTIPFGIILDGTDQREEHRRHPTSLFGMALVESMYDYKGGQGQVAAINDHNIPTKFPEMARIDRCYRAEA